MSSINTGDETMSNGSYMPYYNAADLNSAWGLVEDTRYPVTIEYDPTASKVKVRFTDLDGFTGEAEDSHLGNAIIQAHENYMRNVYRNS